MAGEKLVFLGNCQAGALASIYRTYIAPRLDQGVEHVESYGDSDASRQTIAQADLVIVQRADFTPEVTSDQLGPEVRSYEFPMVAAGFFWPYASRPHPGNYVVGDFDGPYPAQLGDAFLNQMIKNRMPASEAVERYLNLDIARSGNVDRLFELYMERQRIRDQATGYRIADTIERYFRDEHLFLTPDHPNSRIFHEMFAQLCDQIGVPSRYVERALASLKVTPFPHDELPFHPGIIQHFGLRFADETTGYRYFNQGRYTFREFAMRYMDFEYDAELETAMELCLSGGDQAAFQALHAGLQRVPRSPRGHHAMSVALATRGQIDEATTAARQSIVLDPNDYEFHAQLADLLAQTGQRGQAIMSVNRAAELGDRNMTVCARLASLYASAGDMAESERQFRAVLDLDRDGGFHAMFSHFLWQRDRIAEAIRMARRAVELDPRNPHIRELLGNLLIGAKNPAAAEPELRIAVRLAPGIAAFHNSLGHALSLQRRFDAALPEVRQAVELDSGNAHYRGHLGALLLEAGDLASAEWEFRAAIRLAPGVAAHHNSLGHTLARQNRLDDALAAVQRAVELDGGDPHLHAHLDVLLLRAAASGPMSGVATREPSS